MSVVSARRRTEQGPPPAARRAIRGGVVGNYVDQVDIFLPVVALAPALSTIGGPHLSATVATVVVVATLVGRPVGALVLGRVADRLGRAATTQVAIGGAALSTLLIAVVPTHDAIGAGAIWSVVALRFLAGVFLAGQYSAAVPLAMEWTVPRRRGLVSGLIMSMAPWAQATIAAVTAAQLAVLGPTTYAAWGWRASFLAGGLASLAMLVYYRRRVRDAEQPRPVHTEHSSLRDVLVGHWAGAFWTCFGLMSGLWCLTNVVVIQLSAQVTGDARWTASQAAIVLCGASVLQAVGMSLAGHLSTLTGRSRFFVLWGLLSLVLAPWLWSVVPDVDSVAAALLLAGALQVVTVCAYGPVGSVLSELFPAGVRSTAYGVAYSASVVVPALHPYYLDGLTRLTGVDGRLVMLVVGSLLVAGCGCLAPMRRLDRGGSVMADRP